MILFAILLIISVYTRFKTVYNVKIIYTHALLTVYIGLQRFTYTLKGTKDSFYYIM